MTVPTRPLAIIAFLCCLGLAPHVNAQNQPVSTNSQLTYADLADLALPAPIVARATIEDAIRLRDERAVGVPPGHVRYYVEAELSSLIRSDAPISSIIRYLVDAPLEPDGDRPDLEDREVLLMLTPAPGRDGQVRLLTRDSQIEWTPEREQTVRAILTEANAPGAAGLVTGVGSAFSVPGSLPGESETQIFLSTSDGQPVSLSVLRRPNQQPQWSMSLSEIVTNALPPPQPDTLAWYRLACFLPEQLPVSSMESTNPEQVDVARADYRLVVQELGECVRNRS